MNRLWNKMRFLAGILAWLSLALTIHAKTPCTIPAQLEGSFSAVNPKYGITDLGYFASDALTRRFRTSQLVIVGNTTIFLDELMLFNEKILYEISDATQTCMKKPLPVEMFPMEIPADATFTGQVTLGNTFVLGQNFQVNNWEGTIPSLNAKYSVVTTAVGCVPVSSLYYTEKTGMLYAGYYNIVRGIQDPSVLIPPSFCDT